MSVQVTAPLNIKKHSLDEDYQVFSNDILGLGISGKVLACKNKKTGQKCALKVLVMLIVIICIKLCVFQCSRCGASEHSKMAGIPFEMLFVLKSRHMCNSFIWQEQLLL